MFPASSFLASIQTQRTCTCGRGVQVAALAPWAARPAAVAAVARVHCHAANTVQPDQPDEKRLAEGRLSKLSQRIRPKGCDTRSSQDRHDGNQAPAAAPSYTLKECMQMVAAHSEFLVSQGSSNTGSTSAEQYHQVTATLQQHDKPGDCWLFVRCGRWLGSEPGLASAALAVLQVWHVAEGKGDYRLWQLDDRCMLTGEEYFSLTGFEKGTDKGTFKKYLNSVSVITQPSLLQGLRQELLLQQQTGTRGKPCRLPRLLVWLEHQYGSKGYKLTAKGGAHATGEQRFLAAERAAEFSRIALLKKAERLREAEDAALGSGSVSSSNTSSSSGSNHSHSRSIGLIGIGPDGQRIMITSRSKNMARNRRAKYIGRNVRQAGDAAALAAALGAAAAAAAGAGPAAAYSWPAAAPSCKATALQLDYVQTKMRDKIVGAIRRGADDLSATHVPLGDLYPAAAAPAAAAAAASQGVRGPAQTAAGSAAAALAAAAATDAAAADVVAALAAEHQVYRLEQLQQRAEAAEAAAAAAAGQEPGDEQGLAVVPDCHRPFTITMHNPCDDLDYVVAHYEPHALQHATLSSSSSSSSSSSNSSRRGSGGPAADLCEVFYSRKSHLLLQRTSAASEIGSGQDAESTLMAMAGTRNPTTGGGRHAHLSRYHDDLGAEADSFSLAVWRDLSTAGGLRRIADLWTAGIAQLTWSCNQSAADSVRGSGSSSSSSNSSNSRIEFSSSDGYAAAAAAMPQDMQQQAQDVDVNTEAAADAAQDAQQQQREAAEDGVQPRLKNNSPPNYPSPCLLGSPFTTLAVTHNYHSMLHAEPLEHPFSYIMWLDVLAPGSEMQVAYFWLTAGLAFTPLNGSALYIDVRLVPHCSDPCRVTKCTNRLEGRYGAALFIKPDVIKQNALQWAHQDQALHLDATPRFEPQTPPDSS